MVHSDNRLTCAIALTLFATSVALSVFLIAAHNQPFTGQISFGPELLKQVMIPSEAKAGAHHWWCLWSVGQDDYAAFDGQSGCILTC